MRELQENDRTSDEDIQELLKGISLYGFWQPISRELRLSQGYGRSISDQRQLPIGCIELESHTQQTMIEAATSAAGTIHQK